MPATAIGGERNGPKTCSLNLGQRLVEQIAGRRRHDQATFWNKGPGYYGEDVIGAIADEDGIGINAEDAAGSLAKDGAQGSGYLRSRLLSRGAQRFQTRGDGG